MPTFLKTAAWKGYCKKKNRNNQTEIQGYADSIQNTTQTNHDTSVAGSVDLGIVSWTFPEDATVPAIKQKSIDQEKISKLVIEDELADKDLTVLRRLTMTNVVIVGVQVSIGADGNGHATVTARCEKAKWERRTPDDDYAEAEWNPNDLPDEQ
ncbi:MAG: type VI secretion system tube protein Hcp [Gemmataceae bacterium]